MLTIHGNHEIDDDPTRVDREVVWSFLVDHAYWHRSRSRADLDRQLDGAWRVLAAYDRTTSELQGFARAVSDGVSIAYLADVFVLPEARGHGLGTALVTAMIEDGPGAGMRWMLHTRDAHGLYAKFGFAPPNDRYLERPAGRRAPGAAAD